METMDFKDFDKLYLTPRGDFDFSKFKIVCKKCNSDNVEFAGKTETHKGYYGDIDFEHKIIVKCHDCGNAFSMIAEDSGNNSYCDCDCNN